MFWKKLWEFIKSIWRRCINRRTSEKVNTTLDTASVKVFGLDMRVTREVPVGVPYELTVVVPRAEIRGDKKNGTREIILSSITIAHSPRFEGRPEQPRPQPQPPTSQPRVA